MLGPSHLLLAANAYAGYALWTGQSLTEAVIGAVVATAVSDGVLSPDMDQRAPFQAVAGLGGPGARLAGHRQITHLWWVPAALWVWWLPTLDSTPRWAVTALLIGWASHILGDFIFGGKKGIPLVLPGWGPRVGLPLKTDGWIESGWTWLPVSPLRLLLVSSLAALLWVGVSSSG